MELLSDVGHVKSHFFLFGDSVRRTIGLEVVLDTPNGTTR
jgi:hypothetical protein